MNERSAAPNAGGLDRPLHAAMAHATSGIAPAAVNLAYADCLQQYLLSPDKQIELFAQSMRNRQTLFALGAQAALGPAAPAVVEPAAQDKRFADPALWSRPFNVLSRSFLLTERSWQKATTGLPGIARHREDVVSDER
jgi:polyhydroxyalkanoate synthase subunit PhaC